MSPEIMSGSPLGCGRSDFNGRYRSVFSKSGDAPVSGSDSLSVSNSGGCGVTMPWKYISRWCWVNPLFPSSGSGSEAGFVSASVYDCSEVIQHPTGREVATLADRSI